MLKQKSLEMQKQGIKSCLVTFPPGYDAVDIVLHLVKQQGHRYEQEGNQILIYK